MSDAAAYYGQPGSEDFRSLAATEDEKRAAEAAAWRRALTGIEDTLRILDAHPDWLTDTPENSRESLENSKLRALAELEALGEPQPKAAKSK